MTLQGRLAACRASMYSYLAQMADGQQVVVKQIHHGPCVYYQFGNKIEAELRDYNHL